MEGNVKTAESDAVLVKRLQENEQEAFYVIFDRYRTRILAYAEQITRNRPAAEDIVQETFLELVRRIDRIDPEKGLSAWLFRVARNRAIDVLRRAGREMPVEELPEDRHNAMTALQKMPGDEIQDREAIESLRVAFDKVDDRLREVLVLRYHGGLAFREIAATLRRPLGTVLWQARRGLKVLRDVLGRNNGWQ